MNKIISFMSIVPCIFLILASCNTDYVVKEENPVDYKSFKEKYPDELDLVPSSAINIYYAQYLDGMVPRGREYIKFDLDGNDYDLWISKYGGTKNRYSAIKIEQPCPEIGKLSFWPLTLNNAYKIFFQIKGLSNQIYYINLYSTQQSGTGTVYMIIDYS